MFFSIIYQHKNCGVPLARHSGGVKEHQDPTIASWGYPYGRSSTFFYETVGYLL